MHSKLVICFEIVMWPLQTLCTAIDKITAGQFLPDDPK